jgi:hypothetical protein
LLGVNQVVPEALFAFEQEGLEVLFFGLGRDEDDDKTIVSIAVVLPVQVDGFPSLILGILIVLLDQLHPRFF